MRDIDAATGRMGMRSLRKSFAKVPMKRLLLLCCLPAACLLWFGCTTSHETLQAKLNEIGNSDLRDILGELSPQARAGAMLANPRFVVDEYQEFHGDTAIVFQAYASLVFLYLDPSLNLCQVRKYRYRTASRTWDRYYVKLKHTPEKYVGTGNQ